MASYTIQVMNDSVFFRSYVVFMTPPAVTATGEPPMVYPNAWATFHGLPPRSYDSVVVPPATHAWWGTTRDRFGPTARVAPGGTALVNTAARDSVPFVSGPHPGFGSAASPGSAPADAFEIVAGSDFTVGHGYVFGLAASGPSRVPTPLATFPARPNQRFVVRRATPFYVAEGVYAPGQPLDPELVLHNAASVDFSRRPQTTAIVVQGADSRWTVTYA